MLLSVSLILLLGMFLGFLCKKVHLPALCGMLLTGVQAAIGGLPLAAGLACGEAVLTIAVLAIVLTAPLGAFAIGFTYHRLLEKNTK